MFILEKIWMEEFVDPLESVFCPLVAPEGVQVEECSGQAPPGSHLLLPGLLCLGG